MRGAALRGRSSAGLRRPPGVHESELAPLLLGRGSEPSQCRGAGDAADRGWSGRGAGAGGSTARAAAAGGASALRRRAMPCCSDESHAVHPAIGTRDVSPLALAHALVVEVDVALLDDSLGKICARPVKARGAAAARWPAGCRAVRQAVSGRRAVLADALPSRQHRSRATSSHYDDHRPPVLPRPAALGAQSRATTKLPVAQTNFKF